MKCGYPSVRFITEFVRSGTGMYSDERASSPLSTEGSEILSSLSMAGEKGRVKALLTDKHLCFESRTGHALDLRLNTISRVHHHSTTLIPGWMAFIGLILIWVSWRVLVGHTQLAMGLLGILLTSGWVITRRPTLTIDTEAGDCHVVFGNDSNLMRLCILVQKMKEGASLEEARKDLEILHRDKDYPRMTNITEEASKPVPLPEIKTEIFKDKRGSLYESWNKNRSYTVTFNSKIQPSSGKNPLLLL